MEKVSIIIPAFNEEENVKIIAEKVASIFLENPYEIIFIDDGSSDNTLLNLEKMHKEDCRIQVISFSRNFGHQNALKAGLDYASGDCVISMDCDLQHPPELLPELLRKWREGYDIVYTIRKDSVNQSFLKKCTSSLFYKILNNLADIRLASGAADFRLLDRSVVDAIKKFPEANLFLRGLVSYIGFRQTSIDYIPNERFSGHSKYNFQKMLKLALTGVVSFSTKPLQLTSFLGVIISFFAVIYMIYALARYFNGETIQGWTSVLICILFLGGFNFIFLGILGIYISNLLMEVKHRPVYIIKDSTI